jgi:hypothetical protein
MMNGFESRFAGSSARARRLSAGAAAVVLVAAGLAQGRAQRPDREATDTRRCVVSFELVEVLALPEEWALRDPEALAVDHRGDIVIVDSGNHRILISTREGKPVAEFGGHGWQEGQFDQPSDVSVYAGFFIYVLDEGNRRVERFDVDGNYVDRVVDDGEAGTPVAIAVGSEGALYLVDADSQTVLKRSQFDEELDPVGRFGMTEGGLVDPRAVAVGPSREIAVADPGRLSVLVFDEFGSQLYTLSLPDTLLADDVVFDDDACVVVADRTRGAVIAFSPDVGAPTAFFGGDGHSFHPSAIALAGRDELLALDADTRRVFVIEMINGDCRTGR